MELDLSIARIGLIGLLSFCIAVAAETDTELVEPNSQSHNNPQVILIIDDLGDSFRMGKRFVRLPVTLNLSLLPHTPFASRIAELGHQAGHDVMLHFPMEGTIRQDLLGEGSLQQQHNQQQTLALFKQNLSLIPHVQGFNNHMGSLLTESSPHMHWLMAEALNRHLYFVDSKTSAKSVALNTAMAQGVAAVERDVFLDPLTGSRSLEEQFLKALDLADKNGRVVIIAHPYPHTIEMLERELPMLKEHYQWVALSDFFNHQTTYQQKAALIECPLLTEKDIVNSAQC